MQRSQLPRWQCTTRPGDAVILPDLIQHLTLNSGEPDLQATLWSTEVDTVGVADGMRAAALQAAADADPDGHTADSTTGGGVANDNAAGLTLSPCLVFSGAT